MKITFVLCLLLLIGCEHIVTEKTIPERNIAKADSFIIRQIETIKVSQRGEDEDFEDFLLQAKNNALELYGVDTLGIYSSQTGFTPYAKCTPEQKADMKERLN